VSDSQWSLLVGALIVVITRLVDVLLPKGYMARAARRWLVKNDDTDPDEGE
jgi:hypothetical protein